MINNNILSPVDGTIMAIDIVHGEYSIYCDVGLFDGSSLLAPVDGSLNIKSIIRGINLSCDTYKARQLNQRAIVEFPHVTLGFLGGVCSSKIKLDSKEEVKQCEKFGKFNNGVVLIKFSLQIDLTIQIGDKVKAGQTIIGKYDGQ